jgi:cytochrome c oxidase assembly factor CtaG
VSGVTSALADQRLGGTIMWEGSMLVGVAALSAVLIDWMGREEREALRADLRRGRTSPEART